MALAFGEIASFKRHYELHPQLLRPRMYEQLRVQRGERFRKGKDSQGLFKNFLISLIVRDNVQQFASSCDYYQNSYLTDVGTLSHEWGCQI